MTDLDGHPEEEREVDSAPDLQFAAIIISPHFDAIRDVMLLHESSPTLLHQVKFVVDETVHDSERHYGKCRDDGRLIMFAPQMIDLPYKMMIGVIAHELGHAVDFLYPGQWVPSGEAGGKAIWLGDRDDKPARIWRERLWHDRNDDQIEQQADGIVYELTGKPIRYCGRCMVQCFGRGLQRPEGLR